EAAVESDAATERRGYSGGLAFSARRRAESGMKTRLIFASTAALILTAQSAFAGANENWAGQYRADKYLGGRAVFQLTIEQSAGAIQVSFDAAWVDAHGAAPEAEGPAKVSGNTLSFTFND